VQDISLDPFFRAPRLEHEEGRQYQQPEIPRCLVPAGGGKPIRECPSM